MKIIDAITQRFCELPGIFCKKQCFDTYFKNYVETYMKKDKRVIKQAYDKYIRFKATLPQKIQSDLPTPAIIRMFIDHLIDSSKGCGAASTYSRFKKVIAQAVREGILSENPCNGLKGPHTEDTLVKDILSSDEIELLLKSVKKQGNQRIREAFIFCLYTGLRFCDVKELTYGNFDTANMILSFRQSKTGSHVHIPLRKDLTKMILRDHRNSKSSDKVFTLPSHPTCLKELRQWTNEAGIQKHITWHCARHTFATNILINGADVRVTASLLGHSGLRYVERYTRAVDQKKYEAIQTLPPIL